MVTPKAFGSVKPLKLRKKTPFLPDLPQKMKKIGEKFFLPLALIGFSGKIQKSLQITGDKERRRAPLANSYDAKRSEPRRHEGDGRPRFKNRTSANESFTLTFFE